MADGDSSRCRYETEFDNVQDVFELQVSLNQPSRAEETRHRIPGWAEG